MMFAPEDKLRVVEQLIETHRWARASAGSEEEMTYRVLKAIAMEIRAGMNGANDHALHVLDDRVRRVKAAPDSNGAKIVLAQEVIGRWPVIERALRLTKEET